VDKHQCLYLGRFTRTHGYKGELRIVLDCSVKIGPDHPKVIFINIDELLVPFFIQNIRNVSSDTALITLEDVCVVEKASFFCGKEVYIAKKDIRYVVENETADQVNIYSFEVCDRHYGSLGTIESIINSGNQELIRIETDDGEILIPFNDQLVIEINSLKRVVYVDLPEGLIDLNRKF